MQDRIRVLSGRSSEGAKVGVQYEFFLLNFKVMSIDFVLRKEFH